MSSEVNNSNKVEVSIVFNKDGTTSIYKDGDKLRTFSLLFSLKLIKFSNNSLIESEDSSNKVDLLIDKDELNILIKSK